jgi:ankyrin repeat domain-containing protein 17
MVMSEGVTPLMLACAGGHQQCVEILLSLGAETERVDVEGMTAMLYAIRNDHAACVDTLLQQGADPDRVNIPVPINDPEFDDTEGNHGDDIIETPDESDDAPNDFRITPLFYAIERDCRASLLALIRGGCNIGDYYVGRNGEYLQPLELSLCRGRFTIALMLVRLGLARNLAMTPNVQSALAILLQRDEPVFTSLMDQLSSPPPLMVQCRWFVRQCLGRQAMVRVYSLPLPSSLIKYLNIADGQDLVT